MLSRVSLRAVVIPLIAAAMALGAADRRAAASAVYSDGHGDIGVAYEDGALDLHMHLHAGAVVNGVTLGADEEFAPDEIVTLVTTKTARPPGAAFDFTGTGAGQPLWRLFQTNVPGTPFLGLGSEELVASDWVGGVLTWEVASVTGPAGGQFSIWQNEIGGPLVLVSSSDGLPDSFDLLAGGHDHANFGFTAKGVYQVEFTVTGEHVSDGLVTDSAVYTFNVAVPEPGSMTLAGLAVSGIALCTLRRRSKSVR